VDRYLVAAELLGIAAAVVRNKCDLPAPDADRRCRMYESVGYRSIATCAHSGQGVAELKVFLSDHCSVLVGQSGVGKSSLLNALVGEAAQTVGDLSDRRELGRHTTTAAMLYRLPDGGELIDSPGVRRYSPNLSNCRDLTVGFRELSKLTDQCRFSNCRHIAEPGCAIRCAVEQGSIADERYQSYLRLADTAASFERH
jgi:ribosome biogenesis GTPase